MKQYTKTKLEKAGAILIRTINDNEEILLEYRARGYDDWTFPKGDIEAGETPEQTAIRELKEETGFGVELVEKLPDICYEFKQNGRIHEVTQHMFLAKIIDGRLAPEFTSDRLKWVSLADAMKVLTHQDLKDYLKNIITKLRTQKVS